MVSHIYQLNFLTYLLYEITYSNRKCACSVTNNVIDIYLSITQTISNWVYVLLPAVEKKPLAEDNVVLEIR